MDFSPGSLTPDLSLTPVYKAASHRIKGPGPPQPQHVRARPSSLSGGLQPFDILSMSHGEANLVKTKIVTFLIPDPLSAKMHCSYTRSIY